MNTFEKLMGKVEVCEHGRDCIFCCWPWLGQKKTAHGGTYGAVSYEGEKRIAHSTIYRLKNGLPLDLRTNILHHCDVSLCCNYHHCYSGTHQQNMDDMVRRNRQSKGEAQPMAVLSDAKVYQIRRMYSSGGWKQLDLAYYFDVSQPLIASVITRKNWKHLPGEIAHGR